MFLQGFHFCTTLQCKKKKFIQTLCLYPVNEHQRDEKGLSFTSSKRSTFHNSEIMTMTVNLSPPPIPQSDVLCEQNSRSRRNSYISKNILIRFLFMT